MCLKNADYGTISRLLLIRILEGNPEFLCVCLNDETPEIALADLKLADLGGECRYELKKEGDSVSGR